MVAGDVVQVRGLGAVRVDSVGRRYFTGTVLATGAPLGATGRGLADGARLGDVR
jgi:hypothetical protein